jgi:hypothetical protein
MYERLKKDTNWSILKLGDFKTNFIKDEIINFNEEWYLDDSRQKKYYTHQNTQTFKFLSSNFETWFPGSDIEVVKHNELKTNKAKEQLNSIFNILKEYYCGIIISCEAVKLLKNTNVRIHVDGGPLLHYARRIHVPIITNKNISFTVMDETIHMKESGWYEINNQMRHGANNPTNEDRIHLIIDVFPDNMINY